MQKLPEYRYLNLVGFTVDALQPLALFKDEADEATLPLWLEMGDVLSITAELLTSRLSGRGERNDLLDSVLEAVGYKVESVLVDGTAATGYRAAVCLGGDKGEVRVGVGLVTALLTAIRYKLPVGIAGESLASSSLVDHSGVAGNEIMNEEKLLQMLEQLKPEDMGKYPL
jgi:bifunctional DNase/RNase